MVSSQLIQNRESLYSYKSILEELINKTQTAGSTQTKEKRYRINLGRTSRAFSRAKES
jgi:hypothetical protein